MQLGSVAPQAVAIENGSQHGNTGDSFLPDGFYLVRHVFFPLS